MTGFRGSSRRLHLPCACVLLLACGESHPAADSAVTPDGTPSTAILALDPAGHDFGNVRVGEAREVSFSLTNTGSAPTGSLVAELDGAGPFALVANDCHDVVLAPAATCALAIFARASEEGPARGLLRVGGGEAMVEALLTSNGVPLSTVLALEPTRVDFGTETVGETTPPQTVTLANRGETEIGPIVASVSDSDAFVIAADRCAAPLAPGASCTLDVEYAPPSEGPHTGQLRVEVGAGVVTAALAGTATRPPFLQLVPGSQDFGTVGVGEVSAAIDFTLRNVGGGPTGAIGHTSGGADPTMFGVRSTTCAGALDPDASCIFTVVFTPELDGARSATLEVSDGVIRVSSALYGQGGFVDAGPFITPSAADFGTVTLSTTSAPVVFTIENSGGSVAPPLTITKAGANPMDFVISLDGCSGVSLPPGGTCTSSIAFRPTATGARSATLRVMSSGIAIASLTGMGSS